MVVLRVSSRPQEHETVVRRCIPLWAKSVPRWDTRCIHRWMMFDDLMTPATSGRWKLDDGVQGARDARGYYVYCIYNYIDVFKNTGGKKNGR